MHAGQTADAKSFPCGVFTCSYGVYVLCEILSLPVPTAAATLSRCNLLISLEVIGIHARQTADAKSFPRGEFSYGVYVLCECLSLQVSTRYCSCYLMPLQFT